MLCFTISHQSELFDELLLEWALCKVDIYKYNALHVLLSNNLFRIDLLLD
jgi:hypothetical protein